MIRILRGAGFFAVAAILRAFSDRSLWMRSSPTPHLSHIPPTFFDGDWDCRGAFQAFVADPSRHRSVIDRSLCGAASYRPVDSTLQGSVRGGTGGIRL